MTQKFKPILFSTEMVNAILEGRKTQTRRTKGLDKINENPNLFTYENFQLGLDTHYFDYKKVQPKSIEIIKCDYNIGDILWVRETFFDATNFKDSILFKDKCNIIYKADEIFIGCHKWKPSIFMPKAAARIFLKITNVRAERLHDISESDAIAEGVKCYGKNDNGTLLYKDYNKNYPTPFFNPIHSFASLWVSINGIDSAFSNPFVWVIEFEKIDKPENFL